MDRECGVDRCWNEGAFPEWGCGPLGLLMPELLDMPVHHAIEQRIIPRNVGDTKQ
jgi:hypothetical protein